MNCGFGVSQHCSNHQRWKRQLPHNESSQPAKRFRSEDHSTIPYAIEEIESARHLSGLLAFRQDAIQALRHGIASFKAFLDDILYGLDVEAKDGAKAALKMFLDSERPPKGDEIEHPFLSQLWQAWSFASSNNNDHLSSAVCAVLALLLKTLAATLEFRDYGMLLCRTIMQHQHLRYVQRCLDAPKHKEFLLSPSLRLLNEVANYDGGVNVRELYKRRKQTFDVAALRKCLTLTKTSQSTEEETRRRPAVRTLAVRYILSHLKFQDEGGKIDLLKQRPLMNALFGFFRADPPDLIMETLRITEAYVLKDNGLPRSTKAVLLTEQQLLRVTEVATRSDPETPAGAVAFEWLKAASTTPSYGVLRRSGWYLPRSSHDGVVLASDPDLIRLGLEDQEDDATGDTRNPILASWMKELRPSTNLQERQLVLGCFRAAPGLVFDFFGNNALQMDPKLTNTWIGYASFMFEVIDLPVPQFLGNLESESFAERPPRLAYVMNSIMPHPMTHKVLTRCLNQTSNLIAFFAVRLLVIALNKLRIVLKRSAEAVDETSQPQLWQDFTRRLIAEVTILVPKVKDVANLYRKLASADEHQLQREATAKLLQLYHEVLPQAVAEESFDISSSLLPLLDSHVEPEDQVSDWKASELAHLLPMAHYSTTLRWFRTQKESSLSPIISLLKRCAQPDQPMQIASVARSILEQSGVIEEPASTGLTAFDALVSSLRGVPNESSTWIHLDDFLARAAKMPTKYLDHADELRKRHHLLEAQLSLVVLVLAEQAPFVVDRDPRQLSESMKWINHFLAHMSNTSERSAVLEDVRKQIIRTQGWLSETFDTVATLQTRDGYTEEDNSSDATISEGILPFEPPQEESTARPELFRWQRKELDLAFEDRDIDALLTCLSSAYGEVRTQAVGQIQKLCSAVKSSQMEEKEQLFILLGELLETYQAEFKPEGKAMPYLLSCFASRAIQVQLEPTHLMYSKLNRYLMKGPAWRPTSLIKYWLAGFTQDLPTDDDDGYWPEVQWVLDWLTSGLSTQSDFDLLRRTGSLERILAVQASTSSAQKQIKLRLLELVYRAVMIDSTSLVTRAGVLSWLEMLPGEVPKRLLKLVKQKFDGPRIEAWANVPLEVM